jgi:hypothetical protein
MTDNVAPKPQRDKTGRFDTGHKASGPGRPRGSRVKLEEEFLSDLCAIWTVHGKTALETAAIKEPVKFAQIAASILPKHSHHTHERLELKSDAELAAIIAAGLEQRSVAQPLPNAVDTETKH